MVIPAVGILGKIFCRLRCRSVKLSGQERLLEALDARAPLLTFSNHPSVLDDPLMWSCLLPTSKLFQLASTTTNDNKRGMRWIMGAEELLFTNPLLRWFFSTGRVIPVKRGAGVLQPAMNRCIEIMRMGGGGESPWIHIFPEGRVMGEGKGLYRWGIGRLMDEAPVGTIVLPIKLGGFEGIRNPLKWPIDLHLSVMAPLKDSLISKVCLVNDQSLRWSRLAALAQKQLDDGIDSSVSEPDPITQAHLF